MKMRRRIMIGIATGAIAAVAIAGAAFAQSGGTPTDPAGSFLDKLAQRLGIERTVLESAIQSVGQEEAVARLDSLLADAVTAGRITQVQADEIKTWYGSRPAAADEVAGFGSGYGLFGKSQGFGMEQGFGGHHGFGRGGHHGRGGQGFGPFGQAADASIAARLAALVTAGTITQAEADSIQAWVDARPATLDQLKNCPRMGIEDGDAVVPSSSGASNTEALQTFFGIRA